MPGKRDELYSGDGSVKGRLDWARLSYRVKVIGIMQQQASLPDPKAKPSGDSRRGVNTPDPKAKLSADSKKGVKQRGARQTISGVLIGVVEFPEFVKLLLSL